MAIFCIILCFLLPTVFCSKVRNASVAINEKTGEFQIYDYIVENPIAYGTFKDDIFLTGWSYLEVKSDEKFPDPIQAYASGIVEGYLTADLIKNHWFNLAENYCNGEKLYCHRLVSFLKENMNFINEHIKSSRYTEEYWHQVALTLEQLHGIEDGFKNTTSQPSTEVDVMGLFLLNLMGDLYDLEKVLMKKEPQSIFGSGSCSALIKVMPNDIYFSHVTWTSYNTMLRILKKYSLKFHRTLQQGSPVIPGHTYTFSSQPGFLFSKDDFYLLSSGLAVMETTIGNDNSDLWKYVTPTGIVFDWQRNIIANRLARDGREWADLFSIMNSGTYNNQFMILDYNKFQPGKYLQDGLLYVVEQIPGHMHGADVTHVLRKQGYWPSYNCAYFKDIFNMSGGPKNVEKFGDWFTYERTPRALIFKRDQGKVQDIDSLIKLMRYNDYTNDPLSKCNCTPPYSAENAISSRNDLNPANGSYPFLSLGHRQYGGTDLKLTTSTLFKNLEFIAIAGPTYDPLPPFQWSKTDFGKTVRHKGHPDLWHFKPVHHKWD